MESHAEVTYHAAFLFFILLNWTSILEHVFVDAKVPRPLNHGYISQLDVQPHKYRESTFRTCMQ